MYGQGPAPDKMGYHLGAGVTAIREAVAAGEPFRAADLLANLITDLPKLTPEQAKKLRQKVSAAILTDDEETEGVRKSELAQIRTHKLLNVVFDVKEELLRTMMECNVYAYKEGKTRDGSELDRLADLNGARGGDEEGVPAE